MIQKTLEYNVVKDQTEPYNNYPPYQKGSETSESGADVIAPKRHTLQWLVLDYIRSWGVRGATDKEIAEGLNREINTIVPRRRELQIKGLVVKFGKRKNPKTKAWGSVWVTTGQKQKAMRENGLK